MYTVCQKCGKKLTDPESMRRGYGPECGTAQALDAALEGSDMLEKEKQAYKDGVLRAIYK